MRCISTHKWIGRRVMRRHSALHCKRDSPGIIVRNISKSIGWNVKCLWTSKYGRRIRAEQDYMDKMKMCDNKKF